MYGWCRQLGGGGCIQDGSHHFAFKFYKFYFAKFYVMYYTSIDSVLKPLSSVLVGHHVGRLSIINSFLLSRQRKLN